MGKITKPAPQQKLTWASSAQTGKSISELLQGPRTEGHARPQAAHSTLPSDAAVDDTATDIISSPVASAADLQAMTSDIKRTVTDAISDLRTEVSAMNARVYKMEDTIQHHNTLLTKVHASNITHDRRLLEMHYTLEDLDNRDRRKNLSLRGVLKYVESQNL